MKSAPSENKSSTTLTKVLVVALGISLLFNIATILQNQKTAVLGLDTIFQNAKTAEVKSGEEIFSQAKPATVRIGVQLAGTVSTPEPIWDEESGEFYAGEQWLEEPITTVLVGSGFIANPKGYIVTNAHVVDVSTETVSDKVWQKYSNDLYTTLNQNLPADMDQATKDAIYQKLLDFVSANGSINDLTYKIAVFNPNQKEGTYEDFVNKGYTAQLKKVGDPYPTTGKDIAVLKIDKEGFPGLTLGNSKTLKPGSKVYVLGYPAIADINDAGYTQPTFTSGIVSAFKKSSQGDYDVIQIDAGSSGGNSGGPAFNEKGEIIGIATFGSDQKEGYNWILPVEFGREFLDELNVAYATTDSQ